ncbi:MAG: iron-sulfur cluster repair di-iron protein [Acidobacteria bacterium RIFCSPLOWO2_02_FULL_61_28]|nr:MAG: iron-sulfur cluster repair di-iron protein [Acidobacteria bacterium RIFCSPLOWO2_02_FULL_61_28]
MSIQYETPVGEVASTLPASVRVLERYGIDYCCGGSKPLGAACQEKGVPLDQFLADVETAKQSAGASRARDWNAVSASELIAHILEKHHAYLRNEFPRLTQLLEKVVTAHGATHGESLLPLRDVYAGLRGELEQHMWKEENILFPLIQQIERAKVTGGAGQFRGMPVNNPIRVMELEHESAGNALREMRRLTEGYTVPAGGCATYRALFEGFQTLEADLHEHIHLENNNLFPKAVALEESL